MNTCPLCRATLAPRIAESTYWHLILNYNQNLLGKCFLVLRRHLEDVPQITIPEWTNLYEQLGRTTTMLDHAFTPTHFNYAFLQNQDRHLHLHVIPRYAQPRQFAGLVFEDAEYPDHYAVPAPVRRLAAAQQTMLADYLRQHVVQTSTLSQS